MITTSRTGSVQIITVDNPPVNALGAGVRFGIAEAVAQANEDPAVRAIVIVCAGRTFFAGADIKEFGKVPVAPGLVEVIAQIEQGPKPVVAAIHGTALGGGLELAMGCHYRIALKTAQLGLPEVKLGILPGAGGTQRLPRLVGMAKACSMIVTGQSIGAVQAFDAGLLDRLVSGDDLVGEATAFAAEVADRPFTRTCDLAAAGSLDDIDAYFQQNAAKLRGLDAPQQIRRCLGAAFDRSFEDALAVERDGFTELLSGTQSKALRYNFFAERNAGKIDGIAGGLTPLPIRKVGLIGAGTMGGGIAINFLAAGIDVVIIEREQERLDAGVRLLQSNYARSAKRRGHSDDEIERAMVRLTPSLFYDDLADCDLVIEAIFELMDIKKEVFAAIDRVVKPGAILATNTSYLDVDEIASATSRPERVIGLHFFSPANIMKLLEVVRGAATGDQVLITAMSIARQIGKVAVVSGVCHGFIGNRMLSARQTQAMKLIEEGARVEDVDQVLLDFGFPMGPFQMTDLAGLDIGWDPRDTAGRTIRERLCEAGLRGQKNGRGFYDYDADRNRTPSLEAEAIIRQFAADHAIAQRPIGREEILQRLLYPMVNEGALILEENIAQRSSDIDVVWVNGYGWPAYRGGPMFWADTIGLKEVVRGLGEHAAALGADFKYSELLREKANRNEPFAA